MFFKKIFFICFFLGFTIAGWSSEKRVIVVTLDDYAPYCFLKENPVKKKTEIIPSGSDSEKLQGYSWDILRESFHEMGYSIDLGVYPWARAMKLVTSGKADILFPAGKDREREDIFYYSQEPINSSKFIVYVRPDSHIRWEGLQSLDGLVIGVIRGFSYGYKWEARKGIRKYELNEILKGFRMLDEKHLDGFAGYEYNWDYTLRQAGWKNKYKKLPPFDFVEEYAVGLKTNPQVPKMLKDIDAGKKQIVENGKYNMILRKWFPDED